MTLFTSSPFAKTFKVKLSVQSKMLILISLDDSTWKQCTTWPASVKSKIWRILFKALLLCKSTDWFLYQMQHWTEMGYFFHANVLFLYLLKTSENLQFSDVFRGYRNRTLAWIGLIKVTTSNNWPRNIVYFRQHYIWLVLAMLEVIVLICYWTMAVILMRRLDLFF